MAAVSRIVIPILRRSPATKGCAFRKFPIPTNKQVSGRFQNIFIQYKCTYVVALSDGERRIAEKIQSNLNVSRIEVEDISGGCASMYRIFVASDEFKGKRTIQQHRIINNILKDEVKDMHGLTLETTAS